MPPKTDPPTTRSQSRLATASGEGAPSSAETPPVETSFPTTSDEPAWATNLGARMNQMLTEQAQLRAQMTDVSRRVSRLEEHPTRPSTPSEDRPGTPVRVETLVTPVSVSIDRPSDDARVATSSGTGPTSDLASSPFRSRTTPDERNRIACALGKHGMKLNEVLGASDVETPSDTPRRRDETPTSAPTSAPSSRPLTCKHEILGSFDGDPLRLEKFLSRVRDIARSGYVEGWEAAVVAAVPQALKGDAEVWHGGLTDPQIKAMRTVADVARAMRAAFPANGPLQRKEARERRWNTRKESAMSYYFAKVQLLRQAFGDTYEESALAQDVADGLEASMRAYIRLPAQQPTLAQLQTAIAEWEPTWREVHRVPLSSGVEGGDKVVGGTAGSNTSSSAPGSTAPIRPPRSEQRNSPAAAQASTSSVAAPTQPSFGSLASTYDPARVVPASGDQPRMYRRPDSTKVMRLARNCGKCGGAHFDFEHDHLLRSGQVHTLTSLTDDYPEVDEAELGLAPF
ncbi:hypothetical protein A4X13_0g7798 [Tilletia indica]|uniref:Retrotransposon gag domain-containing protein n=1 Tax=Tilletia indica TaxID=43049 RepID=A0A177T5T7_9BASI|nr:hypothetical protein A4X13_0g7798 [Tilletia indica]